MKKCKDCRDELERFESAAEAEKWAALDGEELEYRGSSKGRVLVCPSCWVVWR